MATSDSLSSSRIIAGLRDASGRIRLSMRARHPAVRLGLVLAPFFLLVAAGYWAAGTRAPLGLRHLAQGHAFSSDDLIKIFKALDESKIPYSPDDRRIKVAADQYDQATAILAKLDVGPRPINAIRGTTPSIAEILGTTADREQRERLHDEQLLEEFIDRLPGVVWSVVCIRQPPRAPLSRVPRASPRRSSTWRARRIARWTCRPSRPSRRSCGATIRSWARRSR